MKKVGYLISFVLFCLGLSSIGLYFYYTEVYDIKSKFSISDISYLDNIVKVKVKGDLEGVSCAISSQPDKFDWIDFNNNICEYKLEDEGSYYVYLKVNGKVIKLDDKSKVLDIFVDKNKYYLAVNDTKKIKYKYVSIGSGDVLISSSNNKVAVFKDNFIKTFGTGNAKIVFSSGDVKKEVAVVVTDLIDKMPKKYNYNRSYLSCNCFSFSDEKLLDKILLERVSDAGYGTRAGVVAAARFLTLEFPYRISYFSENGRLGNYSGGAKVDGEGRFYHKGLYLTSSKFDDLNYDYIDKGPAPWGCSIYSRPSKGERSNGLDCSGFTTWAVYNGGFDIEDLAAHGGDDSIYNLNDIGTQNELTLNLALSDEIKAGDLLGEVTVSDGHSAIIVGVDKENYYVAESLWEYPLGVNINTYSKSELVNKFETVNLMDSYYKDDGNYTPMWY